MTSAIRRLEEELGGPLIYRDGKNSRVTALGQDVEMEFRRMQVALRNVRQHSDNWTLGRHGDNGPLLNARRAWRRMEEDLER